MTYDKVDVSEVRNSMRRSQERMAVYSALQLEALAAPAPRPPKLAECLEGSLFE